MCWGCMKSGSATSWCRAPILFRRPIDAPLGEVLAIFRTAGHSRLPVIGETLDDPRGMVHIRDFVDFVAAKAETRHDNEGDGASGGGTFPRRST